MTVELSLLEALIADEIRADEIVAPQYDSLARGGRYQYAIDRPDSFLNVVLSRDDFPDGEVPDDIAARARDHFEAMVDRALFTPHAAPAYYLYGLTTDHHSQIGLMAGLPVEAISEGRVLGHEGTIHERAADLAVFYETARLTSSPVALAFDAEPDHETMLARFAERPPIRDFTGWDGVRQRLWVVDDPESQAEIRDLMSRVERYYITDGHHRVAAAQIDGAVPGWFLGVMFPASQMHVLEYNRCVELDRLPDPAAIAESLSNDWELARLGAAGDIEAAPGQPGEISMLLGHDWYRLRFRGERPDDVVRRLDVCLLHDRLLRPGFGVADDQDPRLSFVVGEDAASRLEEVVRSVPNTVAFALRATTVDELFAVADAGAMMPAKSTWFTPKPRSGLLVVRW